MFNNNETEEFNLSKEISKRRLFHSPTSDEEAINIYCRRSSDPEFTTE